MRFITLDENKTVISIRFGKKPVKNEIESEIGELGQIMQDDGTFIDSEPTPVDPRPTLDDKINYIYYKEMGLIL